MKDILETTSTYLASLKSKINLQRKRFPFIPGLSQMKSILLVKISGILLFLLLSESMRNVIAKLSPSFYPIEQEKYLLKELLQGWSLVDIGLPSESSIFQQQMLITTLRMCMAKYLEC